MGHILLVEDHKDLAKGLIQYLERSGLSVQWVEDGLSAMNLMKNAKFDLVILDVMLPYKDGFSILKEVRTMSDTPVFILSAKNQSDDLVRGFELGADDYVTKPFDPEVLLARIKRKIQCKEKVQAIPMGDFQFFPNQCKLMKDDYAHPLSAKEIKLLQLFVSRPGFVFSRDQIIDFVWDDATIPSSRSVDNLILGLRKILSPRSHIETVHGLGYRWKE